LPFVFEPSRRCARALALVAALAGQARAQSAPAPPSDQPSAPPAAVTARPNGPAHRGPAFQLHLAVDLPVLGILTTLTVTRLYRTGKVACLPVCDRREVNAFDRITAGYWGPRWQKAGDAGLYGILAGAALLLAVDEGVGNGLNDATVVTESIMAAAAISSVLTLAANRPRPFLYSDKAPPGPRNTPNAGMSFLSGHAAVGFATATAVFITERRLHPDGVQPWIALGAGSAIATFIAVARVMGGNHFISDNLFGALGGVSMGVLFPALHGGPVQVVPMVGESERGLAVRGVY
jgi:membrane-associated phospholipid phosphatase